MIVCYPHQHSFAYITVGVVYRPPSGIIKEFFKEWELILKELPEENVIIMGDFNIDLLQPNNEFLAVN